MKNETARREIESLDYYLQNHTNDYSEESHTAMMMAIDALSNSEKPNKWIPVSERLPEFRKEVLTCSNGGFIEIQSLEDSYDGYWENQKGDWTDLEEITAWMPLPEPYREERSGEE